MSAEPSTDPAPEEDKNKARLQNLAKAREAKKKAASIEIVPLQEPKRVEKEYFREIPQRLEREYSPEPRRVKKKVKKRKHEEIESPIRTHLVGFLFTFGSILVSATVPAILRSFLPQPQLAPSNAYHPPSSTEPNVSRNDLFDGQSIFH